MDVHSDPDHNRSVLTFAGTAPVVSDAARALAREAIRLIDMRQHRGVHPRIGAIDVIPFAPLAGANLDLCVQVARSTGEAIAAAHGIPVYLYGAAAPYGQDRTLAALRKGGFEALNADGLSADGFSADGLRFAPDFGPPVAHPSAGAVSVGARGPLIAFNVLLETEDVEVARRVARAVRESSGGLPGVQALGLFLPGQGYAQVSMNLLDFRRTSLADLLDAVGEAARRAGTRVSTAELVGLAPEAALAGLEPGKLPGIPDRSFSIESRLAACTG